MRTKRRISSRDRLSNLPEDVLLRIISFMKMRAPKDACRTSILSKYWRPLWSMLPDVYFCYDTFRYSPEAFESFDRFVKRVLDSRKSKGLAIRKLKLDLSLHFIPISLDSHLISTWIRGAIDCHVQNLQINVFDTIIDVPVPLSVLNSDTITTLKLLCNLSFTPSPVWLPSLKTLVFSNPYICCDEVVRCLLSSCLNLEEFYLDGTYDVIEIRAPKLKKLSARFQNVDSGARSLKIIDAVSLEHLSLRDFFPVKYVIKNLDNVMEAKLTIMVNWIDMKCLFNLFRALANVKFLSLCIGIRKQHDDVFAVWLDEELQHDSLEELCDRYLPQFDNLVHLKFDEICDLGLLPSFLRKSPNLETLVIERHENADASWAKPQEVPSCLLSHLTHFVYKGFVQGEEELKTVEYFLRNSIVLKTVTIQPSMVVMKMMSYLRSKLCAKLEKIPRGSKSCELIVEKKPFRSYDFDWPKQLYIFG